MSHDFIEIKKKTARGEDGYKIVSVRMRDETIEKLDKLSALSNRSRNELINMLLEKAVDIVKVTE
ncbi:MAG: ribbon-helix-helix protein, CopG family [Clostridia bacterium]|nr:ribbon-helix-helix protein, CopG family [Clostridia bacterium]MBR2893734.1 ribbon-helix-helix protein, CopG family [Clostridia bacterium]